MPQNFILNIFSDIFVLLITFSFDFSYFFSDFPSFCIHAAGLFFFTLQPDKSSTIG